MMPAGSPIFTPIGYQQIEMIKKNDLIMAQDGTFHEVIENQKTEFNGQLIGLTCRGNYKRIFMTGSQTIFGYDDVEPAYWRVIDAIAKQPQIEYAAEKAKPRLFVTLPCPKLAGNKTLDSTLYYPQFKTDKDPNFLVPPHSHSSLQKTIAMDMNFGRLLGYIISGGKETTNGFLISFIRSAEPFIEDAFALAKSIFGINGEIVRTSNFCRVRLFGMSVWKFIKKILLREKGRQNKLGFPDFIYQSNQDFVRGLIVGIMNIGAILKKTKIIYRSHSLKFLIDLRMLLLSVGIVSIISPFNKMGGIYQLAFTSDAALSIYSMCGKNKTAQNDNRYAANHKRNRVINILNNQCISRLHGMNLIDYHGQMYSLKTKGSNSFVSYFALKGDG